MTPQGLYHLQFHEGTKHTHQLHLDIQDCIHMIVCNAFVRFQDHPLHIEEIPHILNELRHD